MHEARQIEQVLWMGRGNGAIEVDIQELIIAGIANIDDGLPIIGADDFATTDALNRLPTVEANDAIPIRGVFTGVFVRPRICSDSGSSIPGCHPESCVKRNSQKGSREQILQAYVALFNQNLSISPRREICL
jgi:hypothetical protein